MNFAFFDLFYNDSVCDEIKVIGKDMELNGKYYHMIGMTLKNKKAALFVLEFDDNAAEEDLSEESHEKKTPRESMKRSMSEEGGLFLHAKKFITQDRIYEAAGGNCGALKYDDYGEAYLLFFIMRQSGWMIAKESPFYEAEWETLLLTEIELREEYEHLPDWGEEISISYDKVPQECFVEIPIVLQTGKRETIAFSMKDGSKAECYINQVYTVDVWADAEKRFEDRTYRERMLQHMTEEEFEDMKNQFFQVLAESCPKGKHFMVVEYECTRDVSLRFLDKDSLDTVPKPQSGSASLLFMMMKPEQELGSHGLKMRACVIQIPLEPETEELEAELFSYLEKIYELEERLRFLDSK